MLQFPPCFLCALKNIIIILRLRIAPCYDVNACSVLHQFPTSTCVFWAMNDTTRHGTTRHSTVRQDKWHGYVRASSCQFSSFFFTCESLSRNIASCRQAPETAPAPAAVSATQQRQAVAAIAPLVLSFQCWRCVSGPQNQEKEIARARANKNNFSCRIYYAMKLHITSQPASPLAASQSASQPTTLYLHLS